MPNLHFNYNISEWVKSVCLSARTKKKREKRKRKINTPIENGNKSLSRSSELPGIDSDAHCSDQVCTRRKESRVSFVISTCFSFLFRSSSGSNQGGSKALFFFLFFYYSPSPNIQIFRWPSSKIHSGRNTIQNNIDANLSVRASCRGEKSDQNEVS